MEHTLFIADDDVGCADFLQFLEAVVAVDDSAIEVIEVTCCKTATVKLNHRTEIGRKDGKHVEDHPFRAVATETECFNDFKALHCAETLLSNAVFNDFFEFLAVLVKVDFHKEFLDGFCTHTDTESLEGFAVIFFHKFTVLSVRNNLFLCEFCDLACIEDDVVYKVKDLFKILRGNVKEEADA